MLVKNKNTDTKIVFLTPLLLIAVFGAFSSLQKPLKTYNAPVSQVPALYTQIIDLDAPTPPYSRGNLTVHDPDLAPTSPVQRPESKIKVNGAGSDIKATLAQICANHGYGNTCSRILFAMAWQESRFNPNALGDYRNGNPTAHGWYQIRTMHHVTRSCTSNLACSATWTLERMERFGYTDQSYWLAVERHNGEGQDAVNYARSVIAYANSLK